MKALGTSIRLIPVEGAAVQAAVVDEVFPDKARSARRASVVCTNQSIDCYFFIARA